jgi:hypothetical protein
VAQTSRLEVSGGFQAVRVPEQTLPYGWSADVAGNLNDVWSVVGEASGAYKTESDENLGVDVNLSMHAFGTGVRWSRRGAARIVLFFQVLSGVARASAKAEILGTKVGGSYTRFMLQPGGGLNLKVNETFGVLGQVDYRRVFLDEEEDGDPGQNQFRILVGVRFAL